jgi:hypothetical protein
MKTPLDTRGSRANDSGSARLGKKQPDGTHAHRIAHSRRSAAPGAAVSGAGRGWHAGPLRFMRPGAADTWWCLWGPVMRCAIGFTWEGLGSGERFVHWDAHKSPVSQNPPQ